MAKVGFGIIGCGNIGPVHAEALSGVKGAKLVAVSDVREETAQKLGDRYGAEAYTDYRAMIARPDLHAVCLCVPSGLRVEIAEACAKAGKHILSEKPLEVTTKKIDRIIQATDKAGVLLGCIFQSRFSDDAQQIHQAITEGRFGKLVLGDAYIKWYRSAEYYASGAWRGTKKIDGGGALMNQGIHQIDLLLWFLGKAVRVQAQKKCIAHEGLEVEDLATAMIEFENGAYGVIEGSTATWPGHSARVEVHGTDGSAVMEDGALKFWKFTSRKPVDKKIEARLNQESVLGSGAADPLAALKSEGHRRQLQDFSDAIAKGRQPRIQGREGRRAVELIEAIYRAAETGRAVKL